MTAIAVTAKATGASTRSCAVSSFLQKHKVEYNVLACVARDTAKRPLDIYRFFKDEGVEFIQFTPVVERLSDAPMHHWVCDSPVLRRSTGKTSRAT